MHNTLEDNKEKKLNTLEQIQNVMQEINTIKSNRNKEIESIAVKKTFTDNYYNKLTIEELNLTKKKKMNLMNLRIMLNVKYRN